MIKYAGASFLPFHLQRLEYKESVGPDKDILKFAETSLMMIFTAMGLKIMETPSLIVMRTMRGYSYRSHNDDDGDGDDDDDDGDDGDVANEDLSMEASHGKGVAVTRQ